MFGRLQRFGLLPVEASRPKFPGSPRTPERGTFVSGDVFNNRASESHYALGST